MFRNALIALLLVVSTPVLALDLPLLTFPDAASPAVPSTATTTSTANGK